MQVRRAVCTAKKRSKQNVQKWFGKPPHIGFLERVERKHLKPVKCRYLISRPYGPVRVGEILVKMSRSRVRLKVLFLVCGCPKSPIDFRMKKIINDGLEVSSIHKSDSSRSKVRIVFIELIGDALKRFVNKRWWFSHDLSYCSVERDVKNTYSCCGYPSFVGRVPRPSKVLRALA